MKKKVTILLEKVDDVKEFVNVMVTQPFDANIVSGRHTVDAKSLMGIFSLDTSKPVNLEFDHDNDEDIDAFLDKISDFIV